VTSLGLAVGVVLVLSMAPAAAAKVRFAAPHGTGAQPCLQSDPCNSVKAITGTGTNGVQDHDQVVLEPGTYTPGQIIEVNNAIDVGGQAGAAATILDETGNADFWGILVNNPNATVHDLGIVKVDSPLVGGFASNGGSAERLYVSSSGSGNACVISGAAQLRDSVCSSAAGSGLFASQGATTARNVTASGGGPSGFGVIVGAGGGAHVSLDGLNVIAVNGVDAVTDGSSGVSATLTLSHSNYAMATHSGTGATVTAAGTGSNQTATPLLSADFHELAGSPTIDAGLASSGTGSFDLDRNPRIAPACLGGTTAGNPDIGAYETIVSPPLAACSALTIGKLSQNRKKGTGTLIVGVPGSGLLAASGKGLKATNASPAAAGDVTLDLRASRKARKRLVRTGKARLRIELSWTPTGGSASTQIDKVKLVRRHNK
jgi:hypothetical protein